MAEDRGHDGDVFLGSDEGSLSEDESTATATTTVPSCAMESFLAQSIGDLKLTDLQQSYFDQHHNHEGGIEPSQGGSADVLRLAEVPSDDSSEEGFLSFEEDEEKDEDPVSSEEVGCPDDSSNFRFPSQTEESGLGESGPVVDPAAAATTPPLAESWEIVDEDHFSMKSGKGDTPNGGDNGGKEHGGDNAVEQEEAAKATATNSQPPSRNWLGRGSKHGGTARSGGGGAGLGLAARLMPSFPSSFRAGPTPPGAAAAAAVSPTHLLLLPPPVSHLCVPRGMHIAILVCGTRGDVQPFVIIGQKLQYHGHRVRLATHALYRDYVLESGLEFYPLAGDPKKLSAHMVETGGRLLPLSAEEVKAVPEKQRMLEDITHSCFPACVDPFEPDSSSGSDNYPRSDVSCQEKEEKAETRQAQSSLNNGEVEAAASACRQADAAAVAPPPSSSVANQFRAQAIISNPVTYGHIHVAEYLDVPLHLMFPQPWSPTTEFPHPLSCIRDRRYYFDRSSNNNSSSRNHNNNSSSDGGGNGSSPATSPPLSNPPPSTSSTSSAVSSSPSLSSPSVASSTSTSSSKWLGIDGMFQAVSASQMDSFELAAASLSTSSPATSPRTQQTIPGTRQEDDVPPSSSIATTTDSSVGDDDEVTLDRTRETLEDDKVEENKSMKSEGGVALAVSDGGGGGGGGGGSSCGGSGMPYDARLTNWYSYFMADQFLWLGMRGMINGFRVKLQDHLRLELKQQLRRVRTQLSKQPQPLVVLVNKPNLNSNSSSAAATTHIDFTNAGDTKKDETSAASNTQDISVNSTITNNNNNSDAEDDEGGSGYGSCGSDNDDEEEVVVGVKSGHERNNDGDDSSLPLSSSPPLVAAAVTAAVASSPSPPLSSSSPPLPPTLPSDPNDEDEDLSASLELFVGLEKIRAGEFGANLLNDLKVPFAKMWSPSLVPAPQDYEDHIDVIGNVFPPLPPQSQPPLPSAPPPLPTAASSTTLPPLSSSSPPPASHPPPSNPPPPSTAASFSYSPPEELVHWLNETRNKSKTVVDSCDITLGDDDVDDDRPVFVGFGSMIIKDPAALVALIEASATACNTRVLLQSSWTDLTTKTNSGGSEDDDDDDMKKIDEVDDDEAILDQLQRRASAGSAVDSTSPTHEKDTKPVAATKKKRVMLFHLGPCPHEWLFPRVRGVVHHGGAGTVAAGLRAGKPTLVCPFFGDQYFWAQALERAKVGLNLGPMHKLTSEKLAQGITHCLLNPKVAKRAQRMGQAFEAEDGCSNAVEAFYRHLPLDNMVCDVGVWLSDTSCQRFSNNNNNNSSPLSPSPQIPSTTATTATITSPTATTSTTRACFARYSLRLSLFHDVDGDKDKDEDNNSDSSGDGVVAVGEEEEGESECDERIRLVLKRLGVGSPGQGNREVVDAADNAAASYLFLKLSPEAIDSICFHRRHHLLNEGQQQQRQLRKGAEHHTCSSSHPAAAAAAEGLGVDALLDLEGIGLYRGACGWGLPPPPTTLTGGVYRGTVGFVAKSSQAIGQAFVRPFSEALKAASAPAHAPDNLTSTDNLTNSDNGSTGNGSTDKVDHHGSISVARRALHGLGGFVHGAKEGLPESGRKLKGALRSLAGKTPYKTSRRGKSNRSSGGGRVNSGGTAAATHQQQQQQRPKPRPRSLSLSSSPNLLPPPAATATNPDTTLLTSEKINDDDDNRADMNAESIAIIQQPPTQLLETTISNDSASSVPLSPPLSPSLAQSDGDDDEVVGAFLVEDANGDQVYHDDSEALPATAASDDDEDNNRRPFDDLQHEPSFGWVAALEAAVAFRIVWHLHMGNSSALPPPISLSKPPLQPTNQEGRDCSANHTPIDGTTPSEPAAQAAATATATKGLEVTAATAVVPPLTSCQHLHRHPALAQLLLDLGYSSAVVHAITCELEKTWAVAGMQVTREELVACLMNHPIHDHHDLHLEAEAKEVADAEEADAVAARGAASPSPSSPPPCSFRRQPAGLPPNAHSLCNGIARAKKQQAAQRRGRGKRGVCGEEEDEGVVIPGEGPSKASKDGGLEGGGGEEERAGFRDRLRHGLVVHGLGGELMRHVPSILFQPPQQPPQEPPPPGPSSTAPAAAP